jgi:hypothetical protein
MKIEDGGRNQIEGRTLRSGESKGVGAGILGHHRKGYINKAERATARIPVRKMPSKVPAPLIDTRSQHPNRKPDLHMPED